MGISFQGPTRKPQTPGAVGQIPPQGRGLREREEIRDQDELSCNAVFGKPIGKLWPPRQPPGCVCQRSSVDRTPRIISVRGPPESHPREGTLPWAPPLQGPSPSLGSCRGAGGSPRTESHLFATWQQPGEPREGPALLRGRVWHPPATGLPVFLAQRELGTGVILISDPLPEKRAHGRDRTGTALRQPPARRLQEELSSAFPRSPGSQEDRAEGEDRGGGGPARDAARLPRRQTPSAKGTVPGAPHQTRLLGPQGSAHQDSQPPRPLPVTSASWGAGAGSQVKLVPPEQLARAAPLVPSRPAPQIFTPSSQGCSPSNGR